MENVDIFNINMDDYEKPSTSSSNSTEHLFKPDPNAAKDKVYSAVIRPVYWLNNPAGFNPKKNYIEKKTFYLKNAAEEGGYFDSPFSIGEKCEAMQAFFKLKKDGKTDQNAEDLADLIKPKSSYFYLVYVEKDLVTPENEGKLLIWKAPIQVHNLIENKVNPDEKALKLGKKSEDIFSPIAGRSLEVNVSLKGGFWNYEGCEWQTAGPVTFNGKPFTAAAKDEFIAFISKGEELMKPFIYVPMSAERKQLLLDIITEKTGITFGKTSVPKRDMQIKGVESDDLAEVEKDIAKTSEKPKAKTETVKETAKAESEDSEDINDVLKDLDLDL